MLTSDTHLYHVTDAENLPSILEAGLDAARSGVNFRDRVRPGCVYLCRCQFAVDSAGGRLDNEWGDLILRVPTSRLDWTRVRGDEEHWRRGESWGRWDAVSLVSRYPEMDSEEHLRLVLQDVYGSIAYQASIPPEDLELCWLPPRSELDFICRLRAELPSSFPHVVSPDTRHGWVPPSAVSALWTQPMPRLPDLRALL